MTSEKLLPVGTVIHLQDSPSMVMVIGYYPIDMRDGKVYQYLVTNFPLGLQASDKYAMMNANAIGEIVHQGYEDEAAKEFYTAYPAFMASEQVQKELKRRIENTVEK